MGTFERSKYTPDAGWELLPGVSMGFATLMNHVCDGVTKEVLALHRTDVDESLSSITKQRAFRGGRLLGLDR